MFEKVMQEISENSKGKVIKPFYNGYSILNVANTIMKHFGINANNTLKGDYDYFFDGVNSVVLFVIDALGLNLIKKAMSVMRLEAFEKFARKGLFVPLTSVFPSTTAVALPSISTGLTPSEHGLLGYRFYAKEYGFLINSLFGKPANTQKCGLQIDTNWYMPVKTSFERVAENGVKSFVVTKIDYIRSHFEKSVYRGATEVPYLTSSDMFAHIERLLENATTPLYISAYWWAIDALSHRYGPFSEEVFKEIIELNTLLLLLSEKVKKDTLLIIIADHGQIYSPKEKSVSLAMYPKIKDAMILPVSDLRAPYLYVRGNYDKGIFSELQNVDVLTNREVFENGYFGPSNKFSDRVGDFVFVIKDDRSYSYLSPDEEISLKGKHGGLSEDEMLVPLFMYRKR